MAVRAGGELGGGMVLVGRVGEWQWNVCVDLVQKNLTHEASLEEDFEAWRGGLWAPLCAKFNVVAQATPPREKYERA